MSPTSSKPHLRTVANAEAGADRELSAATRTAHLERMQVEALDVLVIGGGITGAGIALDAVSRGLTVGLIEKSDFASGTSSRSTKLIHGGLRYLERLHLGLVREALLERALLNRLAPHLAQPMPFLVPIYDRPAASPLGSNRLKLKVGLALYDLLAGKKNLARHRWLDPGQCSSLAPALELNGLRGAFIYYDCVTDDARLVIEVIKAAAARGALVANYARATGLIQESGKVRGAEVTDAISGKTIRLSSKVVVNATGVWSDDVARMDQKGAASMLRPSKGIHVIVAAGKINIKASVLVPSVGENRFLFVVPWQGQILIGTTDSGYEGDLDKPVAEVEEVNRLIESVARIFPSARLAAGDVISTFAGLRPLIGGSDAPTTKITREEKIHVSRSGLISIVGGKLTTYRRMAERVVDLVAGRVGRREARCTTSRIDLARLAASSLELEDELTRASSESGIAMDTLNHLARTYGSGYRRILQLAVESKSLAEPLVAGLPHIAAEVVYSSRSEMAVTTEDFLSRRTRISLVAAGQLRSCEERVGKLMRAELARTGRQGTRTAEYLFAYGTLISGEAPAEVAQLISQQRVAGRGSVTGVLFDLGTYPGARFDAAASTDVQGIVFELESRSTLASLDSYEGFDPKQPDRGLYVRVRRTVTMTGGDEIACWAYEYNGDTGSAPPIPGGDYLEWRRTRG
ncbi:MAG TPA: FAD-dependent oxidoreductase [Blastocatellia bacterium]|nr:FAD-dependent oxidoreductase [Blastocatellia bacterium]